MLMYGNVIDRIKTKIEKIDHDNSSVDKIVHEIKTYITRGVFSKGIPIGVAEEIAARIIIIIAMIEGGSS